MRDRLYRIGSTPLTPLGWTTWPWQWRRAPRPVTKTQRSCAAHDQQLAAIGATDSVGQPGIYAHDVVCLFLGVIVRVIVVGSGMLRAAVQLTLVGHGHEVVTVVGRTSGSAVEQVAVHDFGAQRRKFV